LTFRREPSQTWRACRDSLSAPVVPVARAHVGARVCSRRRTGEIARRWVPSRKSYRFSPHSRSA